jgi:hypothetical protein
MKNKIVGISVCMLVLATALPAVGTMNEIGDEKAASASYIDIPIRNGKQCFFQEDCVVWDNNVQYLTVSYLAQDDPPEMATQFDSYPADDFQFAEETNVYWVFWHMSYWMCNYAEGPKDYHYDWNITFYLDDGSGYRPGSLYAGPFTIADEDIFRGEELFNSTTDSYGLWVNGMGVWLPHPVTFSPDTKYWISLYSIGPHWPNSGWYAHSETTGGILLHEAVYKSVFVYHDWTNFTEVYGAPLDMNFILGGAQMPLNISFKKGLGVTATITNLLPTPYNLTNITVTFKTTGGLILNPTQSFFIEHLNVSAIDTIKYYPIGFGRITIEVTAIARGSAAGVAKTNGFLLFFFII